MQSFVKIEPSKNGEIILSFTVIDKLLTSHEFWHGKCAFYTIDENKILGKISEITVVPPVSLKLETLEPPV